MIKVPVNRCALTVSALALGALAGCSEPGRPAASAEPSPSLPPALPLPVTFERVLESRGFSFRVSSPNDSSLSTVTIEASGLAMPTKPVAREIDGRVVGAAVGDLDANGLPEVYVFGQSAGSGSYGSVVALAVSADRASLVEITLPEVGDDPGHAAGYMGHDGFEVAGTSLLRRFPLYGVSDSNAAPSGKTRQLEYTLSWAGTTGVLRVEKVTDY